MVFALADGRFVATGMYDPRAGNVGTEAAQLEPALLDGVAAGEHAPDPGAAACRWVEQHGLLDRGQDVQESADREASPAWAAWRRIRWALASVSTQ
jgi:hypothetical protein